MVGKCVSNRETRKRMFPELAKIIFSGGGINNYGIRRFNAARRLRRAGYLLNGQPADYLDILKGVEKQLGGTNWNKCPIKSISGSKKSLNRRTTAASHL